MVTIGPVVSEEKSFEKVDGQTTGRQRTTKPAYTISYPGAFCSGELRNSNSDLDLNPRRLKLELDQDIIILITCVKLHQNRPINKGDRVMTMFFSKNSHCYLALGSRMLILNFVQDIAIIDSCVKQNQNQSIK